MPLMPASVPGRPRAHTEFPAVSKNQIRACRLCDRMWNDVYRALRWPMQPPAFRHFATIAGV